MEAGQHQPRWRSASPEASPAPDRPGSSNLVIGDASVGNAVVGHDGVDGITFTGSTAGPADRAAAAARGVVQAEMGGRTPRWSSMTPTSTSPDQVMLGAFRPTGQCTATSRLVLTDGIAREFLDARQAGRRPPWGSDRRWHRRWAPSSAKPPRPTSSPVSTPPAKAQGWSAVRLAEGHRGAHHRRTARRWTELSGHFAVRPPMPREASRWPTRVGLPAVFPSL